MKDWRLNSSLVSRNQSATSVLRRTSSRTIWSTRPKALWSIASSTAWNQSSMAFAHFFNAAGSSSPACSKAEATWRSGFLGEMAMNSGLGAERASDW